VKRDLSEDVWKPGAMVAARVTRAFGNVDLAHAHVVLPAGLLGTAVSKSLGVPLIVREHSCSSRCLRRRALRRSRRKRVLAP